MIAGGLLILKYLAIGIGVCALATTVIVVGAAFILSGRISREEGVNYGELVERLRQAETNRVAQAVVGPAANDHGVPLDLVRP